MRILVTLHFLSLVLFGLPAHFVSSKNISVGDTIIYTVKLPAKVVTTIAPTFNGFEIIDKTLNRTQTITEHQFKLQLFSIDEPQIPTMTLASIRGQKPVILDAITINVKSLVTTKNELNDIAPIYPIFYINWTQLSIILILLFAIAFLIFTFKNKSRKKSFKEDEAQIILPLEKALNEIATLRIKINNDPMVLKLICYELTEIFCEFLTNQTGINVTDSTTVEMKEVLKVSEKLSAELIKNIIIISSELDYFKFSKNPEIDKKNIEGIIGSTINCIKKVAK